MNEKFFSLAEEFRKNNQYKESVENYKACVEYFLTNDTIPDSILKRVEKENKNFVSVINEIMETDFTFDEMIKEYKSEYLENRIYSSATVLFCSGAFSNVFDVISAPKPDASVTINEKVGRNDPCPCGSGKKYKLCCGRN